MIVRTVKRDQNAGATMSFQHLGGWSRKIGNLRQAQGIQWEALFKKSKQKTEMKKTDAEGSL